MADEEASGDEETRQLFEALEERFSGSATQTRKLTSGQRQVLKQAKRIHRSLVRPAGDGPGPDEFPSVDDVELEDIQPRAVRRTDTVTITGTDLYGVVDVRVGGARAPIVRRGHKDLEKLDTVEVFIPENAQDGCVHVNGEREEELDLELIEDYDWKAS